MEVTEKIFHEYKKVQSTGKVNMMNKTGVQRVANSMGLHNLVVFIEDGEYTELLENYEKYMEKWGYEEP